VVVWGGEATWREVADLRENLFDAMDAHLVGVRLDVRRVTVIDRTGIALLIGANHRSHSMRRPLIVLDDDGLVTAALTAAHVVSDFNLVRTSDVPAQRTTSLGERHDQNTGSAGGAWDRRVADRPIPPATSVGVRPDPAAVLVPLGPSGWVDARRQYLDAVWQGERSTATGIALGLLAAGVPGELIICNLLAEAQAQVGRAWQQGRWSIAGEHLATSITESVLHDLTRDAMQGSGSPVPGSRGQTAVVCGEDEWHALPALMATAVLRLRGVHVTYVAPSLPADDLVEYLIHDGPTVVAVACSAPMNLAGSWRSISALRSGGMIVVCGGQGFGRDGRWGWSLGADQWAPDLTCGADRILAAIDSPARPPRGPAGTRDAAAEVTVLMRERDQHLVHALETTFTRVPSLALTDTTRRATRDRLEAVLRIVASATIVSDPAVATDHVHWLESLLQARSQPLEWAGIAFGAVLDTLPAELTHARAMALTGSAACGRTSRTPTDTSEDWTPPTSREK
jgi:methanogenic corrinoid protein MtbC1